MANNRIEAAREHALSYGYDYRNYGDREVPEMLVSFAEAEVAKERRKIADQMFVHLPQALEEFRSLPDVESYWLDLAFGVTPCLMVRYDSEDPKTERIRLWTADELQTIWAKVEAQAETLRSGQRDSDVCEHCRDTGRIEVAEGDSVECLFC